MDCAFIPREEEPLAEVSGIHGARKTAPDLEHIRAEASKIAHETIAHGQAAGARGSAPAPPAPPFRPGGIRERAAAPVTAAVVQIDSHHRIEMHPTRFALMAAGLAGRWVRLGVSVSRAGIAALARERLGASPELERVLAALPAYPPHVLASPFDHTAAPSTWRLEARARR